MPSILTAHPHNAPPLAPPRRAQRGAALLRSAARHRSGDLLLLLLLLLDATITAALLLLLLPLVNLLRLRLVMFQLLLLRSFRCHCMSSCSPPACNQSRNLEPSSRKAANGRCAEPRPQGSYPLASASLELACSASTWLVRATVPNLALVLADDAVPRAQPVGQVELTHRATT